MTPSRPPRQPGRKSSGGLRRLFPALRYCLLGLGAAWRHEAAFRQELALAAALVPGAFFLGRTPVEIALLIAPMVLVLVVELLNSAVEALADALSTDTHPLLGRAKDLGSAAVLLSLLLTAGIWAAVAVDRFTG